MAEKPVHEQVDDLLAKWNPPPTDHTLERIVGVPTQPGDTAATATVPMEELNRHINPASDTVDAQRLSEYQDDGDDDGDGLDDLGKKDLQKEAEKRDLSKSGSKDDLKARIREYDAEQAGNGEE